MVYIHYKCPNCPEFHFDIKGADVSHFKNHLKDKHGLTDDISNYEIKYICPITFNTNYSKDKNRGSFWKYIKELKLDDKHNINYDYINTLIKNNKHHQEKNEGNRKLLLDVNKEHILHLKTKIFNNKKPNFGAIKDTTGNCTGDLLILFVKIHLKELTWDNALKEIEDDVEEDDVEEDDVEEDDVEEDKNSNLELNKIYNMDCYEYLSKLPDQHIDSIILDPPYYEVVKESWDNQWKTFNDYLDWFAPIIKELNRVSKYSCSCFVFGFPHQLSYLLPLFEKEGFKYRQYICVSKGLQAVAGRTSQKLKMFPTASEYILYFYKDATPIIKKMLQDKQSEFGLSGNDINEYLVKASNGGGTWSTIAGKRQQNIQNPTREDWNKLETLFGGFDIKYDDYVYKFNLPNGLTDVWTDINFNDRTYKKIWNEKYNEKCSHPTMKPYDLIKRLVECSTISGDIVLDIFMGTGMTGLVCKNINRHFMGCELDKTFVDKSLIHIV